MNAAAVRVAFLSELNEGEPCQVQVHRKFIVLVKTDVGVLAMDDMCSHAHCFLSSGWLEGHVLVCPCHGAEFDIQTGNALNSIATRSLKLYPVSIEGNDVYIVPS